MPPVNGKRLTYRIGKTDRVIGEDTDSPEDFIVLNETNGNTFKVVGGKWAAGGVFPADLRAAWYGTTTGKETMTAFGCRIGTTDRVLGGATEAPDGFLVINTTNNKVFRAQSGVWVDGGAVPAELLSAWQQA
jgi:hypothetical protein